MFSSLSLFNNETIQIATFQLSFCYCRKQGGKIIGGFLFRLILLFFYQTKLYKEKIGLPTDDGMMQLHFSLPVLVIVLIEYVFNK